MDYVNLGKTGLKVSRICLGCMSYGAPATGKVLPGTHAWTLNEEDSQPLLRQALELGINFFDTANVYSHGESEVVLGRFLKANTRREAVVIATKVHGIMREEPNGSGLSRKEILFELDESLRRLQTDYVDLYQIHRWDYETPIEETLEALSDVVKSGKVRYIGASSMHAWQFTRALDLSRMRGWSRFVSMQNHYNLIYREEEREMIPFCRSEGIALLPWSPLARGRLVRPWKTASTKRLETDQYGKNLYSRTEELDHAVIDRVGDVAERRGVSRAQVSLAWMLDKPAITAPIVGATKPLHLTDAAAALSLHLAPEEVALLEEPYAPHPILGFN
ncbi:MAG TPA: aldo/keto reductase [Candidatus Dormibacteraeota bacterium]|nr:aldo/keto reductase [Candidatus Dormibacteraeota bacterium]